MIVLLFLLRKISFALHLSTELLKSKKSSKLLIVKRQIEYAFNPNNSKARKLKLFPFPSSLKYWGCTVYVQYSLCRMQMIKFMQRIVFQRNVTYNVHCNRPVLSAVNFHNCHTHNNGCTVETYLLKLKKLHYF